MLNIMGMKSLIENALYGKCLFKTSIALLQCCIQQLKHRNNPKPSKGLILVAEDDYLHKKLDTMIIERSGYDVILTMNGRDTLEKFKEVKNSFDLILLDAGLPGVMGTEVCRKIREMGFPAVPIIFLTANIEQFAKEAKAAGASECLAKPLTPAVWKAIRERWLKKNKGKKIK